MIVIIIAAVILAVDIPFILIISKRNHPVHDERMRVLELVSEAAEDDIVNFRDWTWRYDMFREISYNRMLFSFRPVRSFYAGHPAMVKGAIEADCDNWSNAISDIGWNAHYHPGRP